MIYSNLLTNTVYAAPTCPFYGCSAKASATEAGNEEPLATPDGAVRGMQSYRCTNGHSYLFVGGEQA